MNYRKDNEEEGEEREHGGKQDGAVRSTSFHLFSLEETRGLAWKV